MRFVPRTCSRFSKDGSFTYSLSRYHMTQTTASATSVRTFTIDKAHSEVTFQVRHLVTKVRGHFTDFSGAIQFDEAQPEKSAIAFSVNTASIDTAAADRDAHLRSEDFFAADKHPSITFTSSKVTRKGGEQFTVEGTLTIRNTAKVLPVPA